MQGAVTSELQITQVFHLRELFNIHLRWHKGGNESARDTSFQQWLQSLSIKTTAIRVLFLLEVGFFVFCFVFCSFLFLFLFLCLVAMANWFVCFCSS